MTPQQSNTNTRTHTNTHTGQPESTWLRMTFLLYDSLVDSVSVFSSLCVYSMKQDRLVPLHAWKHAHAEVTALQPSVIGHHVYSPLPLSCAAHRVCCRTVETVPAARAGCAFSFPSFVCGNRALFSEEQRTTWCFMEQKHSVRRAVLVETDPCAVQAVWKDSNPPAGWGLQRAWVSWIAEFGTVSTGSVLTELLWENVCVQACENVLQNPESFYHSPTQDFTFWTHQIFSGGTCRSYFFRDELHFCALNKTAELEIKCFTNWIYCGTAVHCINIIFKW